MRTPWRLVPRHLRAHWVRTGLTAAAMMVAVFLLCFLMSIVTVLEKAVSESSANRVVPQSAVSLFVELPLDYHGKIAAVPGVENVAKFQWFGGYYRTPEDFFAQFAVSHEVFFDMYERDMRLVEGPNGPVGASGLSADEVSAQVIQAMSDNRRAAIVGQGLIRDFEWKVGDLIPMQSVFVPKADGSAWEFEVVGVYEPLKANFDDRTMFFRWDYYEETCNNAGDMPATGVGTYSVTIEEGYESGEVAARIDALFANGPQRTWTPTEAVFQATFVAMLGNVPLFVSTIGGAVAFAIFFSVVNTMLMAARQRSSEAGILKALGFRNGVMGRLMLAESILLSLVGGGLGVSLAIATQEPFRQMLGAMLPQYAVLNETAMIALGVSLLIGVIAGIGPAVTLSRLKVTDALRSEG